MPLRDRDSPHPPQNVLFFLSRAGPVIEFFFPLNRLVNIDRHPFLVFGERRVRLLQITEFARFVRRTRYVRDKQCPEFGCLRSVLFCREHLPGPFCCTASNILNAVGYINSHNRWATKISGQYYTDGAWPSRLRYRWPDPWSEYTVKIAQIAPLMESVPPRLYGGTERIVSYLTDELVRLGHEVTLFASADSITAAELVGCASLTRWMRR
jgi:hypothetical protein